MPRIPRSVVVERKKRAWELSQQGWSEKRIAEELGVDRTTVSRYLTSLSRRALAQLEDEVAKAKAIQLRQLQHVIDEAFQAWRDSRKPEQTVSKKVVPATEDGGENHTIITTKVRGQSGNPRHLRNAMTAMAEIRELLGIEPPEDGQLLTMDDVQRLFDQLPPGAQSAYLRLVELYIGGDGMDRVSEEEPERLTSRSGQTYFT